MISLKKALQVAAENGINDLSLRTSNNTSLTVEIDNGVPEKTQFSSDSYFVALGAIEGHKVSFHADVLDKNTLPLMIKSMKEQKDYTKEFDTGLIVDPEGLTYTGYPVYSSKVSKLTSQDLIEVSKELYEAIKSTDERIINLVTETSSTTGVTELVNSKGLHLKKKEAYVVVSWFAVAKEGEEVVSYSDVLILKDLKSLKKEKIAKETAKALIDELKAKKGSSGVKKCLIKPHPSLVLLQSILSHLSMFDIDQDLSLLKDTQGKKVFSEKLTVLDKPMTKDIYSTPFDSEGYPTSNKELVKDGVVMTYLYDQEMAQKYNHEPTGNGFGSTTIHPALTNVEVLPGEKAHKELLKEIEDGYLITSISGVHSGLNGQTGDFTLSGEGYYVKGGKVRNYVNQLTLSGNILELLKNVVDVSKDQVVDYTGSRSPYLLVKDIVISC